MLFCIITYFFVGGWKFGFFAMTVLQKYRLREMPSIVFPLVWCKWLWIFAWCCCHTVKKIISNRSKTLQLTECIVNMIYKFANVKQSVYHRSQNTFWPWLMPTNCSAAKQLPQFCKHSKSADLLRKSLLSHVWRVPSSKALSCKHERLFDLLTLASSFDIRKTDNEYMLFYIGQIADGSL